MNLRRTCSFCVLALPILVGCHSSATHADPPKATQADPRSEADYLGFWEVTGRSDSGLGSALEILPEGKCKWGMIAILDYRYELNDGSVAFEFDDKRTPPVPVGVIEDGTWTMGDGETRIVRTRISKAEGDNWILGVWRYPHYTGATAYERFNPDGSVELRVPTFWQKRSGASIRRAGGSTSTTLPRRVTDLLGGSKVSYSRSTFQMTS
jgi:hypothetical protein